MGHILTVEFGIIVVRLFTLACFACGPSVALADSTGAVVERYRYDACGLPEFLDASGTVKSVACSDYGNPLLFQGRNYDPETGLYNFRARYYSPSLGRFLSRDPNEYADATNLYQYCLQNPGNLSDPSGEILPLLVLGGAAIAMWAYNVHTDFGRSADFSYKEQLTWGAAGAVAGAVGYGVGLGIGATSLGTAAAGHGAAAWGATALAGAIEGAAGGVAFQGAMDVGHGEFSGVGAYAKAAGIGAAGGALLAPAARGLGVAVSALRGRPVVARTGMPPKAGTMNPQVEGKWTRFLERRGVTIQKGGLKSWLMRKWYGAEAVYRGGTIYLAKNPTRSAFFEESFHAIQHGRGLPWTMRLQGQRILRWEYEAKRALIRYRHRLGIPNVETRQTIWHLEEVMRGEY